jgi:hypothetical protein
MNIPLDRLYDYICSIAGKSYGDCVIIYRFFPHGSKNINNLVTTKFQTWLEIETSPIVWCNDQEPLDYNYYKLNTKEPKYYELNRPFQNRLAPAKNINYQPNIFLKHLLLHSEKRSSNLIKYEMDNHLIPVYYWSHAVIARDWFRYAQHANFQKKPQKTFLIYNRAWTGTREYRLKFTDLLVENNLLDLCKTFFNPTDIDTNTNYLDFLFANSLWKPKNLLDTFLPANQISANASADFDINDYNTTEIEVVLETLFDDTRLHLTEKILRPIACRQPFILGATHGSLAYLREYGFKTFATVWDESYDDIIDPEKRLQAIIDLMKQIANLNTKDKKKLLTKTCEISLYNQSRFFSNDFFQQVTNELKTNLDRAFSIFKSLPLNESRIDFLTEIFTCSKSSNFLNTNANTTYPTRDQVDIWLKITADKSSRDANTSSGKD